jgi:hypothetical protein
MTDLKIIDEKIRNNELDSVPLECYKYGYPEIGFMLGKILNRTDEYLEFLKTFLPPEPEESKFFVSLHCNWVTSEQLIDLWKKMSQSEECKWNNIFFIPDSKQANYHIIINSTEDVINYSNSILFQMEPNMKNNEKYWGKWASPKEEDFLKVFTHDNSYNNCEWHLGLNYTQLKNEKIEKDPSLQEIISTVLSSKYHDPGHIKRVDFAKFLDTKQDITLHVFGHDLGYKHYKGSLPYHIKDKAMIPYFYTFNVENQEIPNYFTEKIIDSLLSESLIFYHGPKNIRDYFDERAFVWLELEDFEADYNLIKKVISEDWRTLRLPYIRKEKNRILDELQFFPRIENIIKNINK